MLHKINGELESHVCDGLMKVYGLVQNGYGEVTVTPRDLCCHRLVLKHDQLGTQQIKSVFSFLLFFMIVCLLPIVASGRLSPTCFRDTLYFRNTLYVYKSPSNLLSFKGASGLCRPFKSPTNVTETLQEAGSTVRCFLLVQYTKTHVDCAFPGTRDRTSRRLLRGTASVARS